MLGGSEFGGFVQRRTPPVLRPERSCGHSGALATRCSPGRKKELRTGVARRLSSRPRSEHAGHIDYYVQVHQVPPDSLNSPHPARPAGHTDGCEASSLRPAPESSPRDGGEARGLGAPPTRLPLTSLQAAPFSPSSTLGHVRASPPLGIWPFSSVFRRDCGTRPGLSPPARPRRVSLRLSRHRKIYIVYTFLYYF